MSLFRFKDAVKARDGKVSNFNKLMNSIADAKESAAGTYKKKLADIEEIGENNPVSNMLKGKGLKVYETDTWEIYAMVKALDFIDNVTMTYIYTLQKRKKGDTDPLKFITYNYKKPWYDSTASQDDVTPADVWFAYALKNFMDLKYPNGDFAVAEYEIDAYITIGLSDVATLPIGSSLGFTMNVSLEKSVEATKFLGFTIQKGITGSTAYAPSYDAAADMLQKRLKLILEPIAKLARFRQDLMLVLESSRSTPQAFHEEDFIITDWSGATFTFTLSRTPEPSVGWPVTVTIEATLFGVPLTALDEPQDIYDAMGAKVNGVAVGNTFREFLYNRFANTLSIAVVDKTIKEVEELATNGMLGLLGIDTNKVLNTAGQYLSNTVTTAADAFMKKAVGEASEGLDKYVFAAADRSLITKAAVAATTGGLLGGNVSKSGDMLSKTIYMAEVIANTKNRGEKSDNEIISDVAYRTKKAYTTDMIINIYAMDDGILILLETGYNDKTGKHSYRLDKLVIKKNETTTLITLTDVNILQHEVLYNNNIAFLLDTNRMIFVRSGWVVFDVTVGIFDRIPNVFGAGTHVITDMYSGKISKNIKSFKYLPKVPVDNYMDDFLFELETDIITTRADLFVNTDPANIIDYGLAPTERIYLKGNISKTVTDTTMISARFLSRKLLVGDADAQGIRHELFNWKYDIVSTRFAIDVFDGLIRIGDIDGGKEYNCPIDIFLDDAMVKPMSILALDFLSATGFPIEDIKTFYHTSFFGNTYVKDMKYAIIGNYLYSRNAEKSFKRNEKTGYKPEMLDSNGAILFYNGGDEPRDIITVSGVNYYLIGLADKSNVRVGNIYIDGASFGGDDTSNLNKDISQINDNKLIKGIQEATGITAVKTLPTIDESSYKVSDPLFDKLNVSGTTTKISSALGNSVSGAFNAFTKEIKLEYITLNSGMTVADSINTQLAMFQQGRTGFEGMLSIFTKLRELEDKVANSIHHDKEYYITRYTKDK